MALSTVNDYKAAINGLLYYVENNFGGLDRFGIPRVANISPEDFATLRTAYATYKQTRDAAPTQHELHPGQHGTHGTTYSQGGVPVSS